MLYHCKKPVATKYGNFVVREQPYDCSDVSKKHLEALVKAGHLVSDKQLKEEEAAAVKAAEADAKANK